MTITQETPTKPKPQGQPQAQAAPLPPTRHDLYYSVHKGIRFMHCQIMTALGTTDWSSNVESLRMSSELRRHMEMCADHLRHEDEVIHKALEAKLPGASMQADEEHDAHQVAFDAMTLILDSLQTATGPERQRLGKVLYKTFCNFVAADLAHMEGEETVLQRHLHELYSDEDLQQLEGQIVAGIAPDMMVRFMRAIVSAQNWQERDEMLGAMQAGMPKEAFDQLMAAIADTLSV